MGVQVAILDAGNRPLPPGKIGEVCSRGPNVTKGYLNNPAANKEAFAGGSTAPEAHEPSIAKCHEDAAGDSMLC